MPHVLAQVSISPNAGRNFVLDSCDTDYIIYDLSRVGGTKELLPLRPFSKFRQEMSAHI